jgi:hypothetical protein
MYQGQVAFAQKTYGVGKYGRQGLVKKSVVFESRE